MKMGKRVEDQKAIAKRFMKIKPLVLKNKNQAHL